LNYGNSQGKYQRYEKGGDMKQTVTEYMIPGNRPEDEEIEIPIVLTIEEIDELRRYVEEQLQLPLSKQQNISYILESIVNQLEDYS
jgi:hypothetical protein